MNSVRARFRYVCPQALFRFLSPCLSSVFFFARRFSRCAQPTDCLEEPGQVLLKAQNNQSSSGPLPVTQRNAPWKQVPSLPRARRCMTQREPELELCRYCIQAYIQINTSQYLGTWLLAGLVYLTFLDRGPELEKVSVSCKALADFQPQEHVDLAVNILTIKPMYAVPALHFKFSQKRLLCITILQYATEYCHQQNVIVS